MKPRQAIDKLSSLQRSDGWKIVANVMDEETLNAAIQLSEFRNLPIEEIHFRRGAMWAARQLKDMPEKLIMKYKNDLALDESIKDKK